MSTFGDYTELILFFPLTSIKSEDHYKTAQKVMDELVTKGPWTAGEELYLDALSDLIIVYEDAHHPIPPASDATIRPDKSPDFFCFGIAFGLIVGIVGSAILVTIVTCWSTL
jgi:hypothetical protein